MATQNIQSEEQILHESRVGLHSEQLRGVENVTNDRQYADRTNGAPATRAENTSVVTEQRPSQVWAEYALAVLCCGSAIEVTQLFRTNPSISLFFCLAAVAVTAQHARLGPRLLVGTVTACFTAYFLPPNGSLMIAADYRLLFAIYLAITVFLCVDGRSRLPGTGIPHHQAKLPRPSASPEEILDTDIKRVARSDGDVTVPRIQIYTWMRECAHVRDLIWNIDDCWRRRDWNMLTHTIRVAYKQVAQLEHTLLQNGAEALQDPVDPAAVAASVEIEPGQTPVAVPEVG